MESFRLSEKDNKLLNNFMKENNIENRSEAIRLCIRKSVSQMDLNNFMFDLNNKMNRLVHNQFLTRKLLEQFFVNMKFTKNSDIDSNEALKELYKIYNNYNDNFLR